MPTPTTATNASPGADDDATVVLTGSGLVFHNTFGQGITDAYKADIVDAEHDLQAICTNDCDISREFQRREHRRRRFGGQQFRQQPHDQRHLLAIRQRAEVACVQRQSLRPQSQNCRR